MVTWPAVSTTKSQRLSGDQTHRGPCGTCVTFMVTSTDVTAPESRSSSRMPLELVPSDGSSSAAVLPSGEIEPEFGSVDGTGVPRDRRAPLAWSMTTWAQERLSSHS